MRPRQWVVAAISLLLAGTANAQTLPPGFYVENAASGAVFNVPTAFALAPDGRIFVGEKAGLIYIVANGVKLPTPFLDIQADVLNHHDRGVMGMELDPDFANNGYVYLSYTFDWNGTGDYQRTDVAGRLVRYTVSALDSNLADTATRTVLIGSSFSNAMPSCYFSHAPGDIHFGSDGSLFVAAGDAASYSEVDAGGLYPDCFGPGRIDPSQDIGAFRSQLLSSLSGKILRIDPATGEGLPSNPFYTGDPTDVESKVWAYGLRNPFRFGIRPGGSTNPADGNPGTLYIGDVGWNAWEELNVATSGGENFGWPCYEGPNIHSGYQAESPSSADCSTIGTASNPSLPQPGMTYWEHSGGVGSFPTGVQGSAAIGGDFYVGGKYPPQYVGRFFYGDYADQWMKVVEVDTSDNYLSQEDFATGMGGIVDLRYDPVTQYMHYLDIFTGQVMRLRHTEGDANAAPIIVANVTPLWGYAPLAVTMTASASTDPNGDPISFLWDFGSGLTSTAADTSYTYAVNGTYTVALTVTDDFGVSSQRQWSIAVGNTPPVIQIITPDNGIAVSVGTQITLAGFASDAEDPEASLVYDWEVTQVHNDHDHPNFFTATTKVATMDVLEHGLPHEVNYLRAQLRAMDTGGLTSTLTHFIVLNRANEIDITDAGSAIALITSPTGTGNPSIDVIHDNVYPMEGSSDPLTQYDTYDGGAPRALDWIGYSYPSERFFSRLIFQEGMHNLNGGWFDSVWVEVRTGGVWSPARFDHVIPPYRGIDGNNFDLYTVTFEAAAGDGVRLIGVPGGSADYISVAELRVDEIPRAEFTADVTSGPNPLAVSFTDLSIVTNPVSWLWNFGDGASSTSPDPMHVYTIPGPHTVNLSVVGDEGTFFEEKRDYIFVGTPGLLGEYYDNSDFTGTVLTRIDTSVVFNWGPGPPDVTMGADSFSVRWSGWIRPAFSETYTFHTTTDDGVRLWVNKTNLVSQWFAQPTAEHTGAIALVAGNLYELTMEYFDETGGAEAKLEWSSPSQTREVIPQDRLFARECPQGFGDVDGNGVLSPGDALCAFNIYLNGQTVTGACNAPNFDCEYQSADTDCNGTITPSDALNVYNRYLAGLPLVSCFAQSPSPPASPGYRTRVARRTVVGALTEGDVLEVTFAVNDPASFDAFGLRVKFPSDRMRFLGMAPSMHTENWTVLDARQTGGSTVTLGGFDRNGISRVGEVALFTLHFSAPDGSGPDGIEFVDLLDDLEDATVDPGGGGGNGETPTSFRLYANYPNPFNPETSIRFDLPGNSAVRTRLSIYSVRGELVRVLVDEMRPGGLFETRWDGRNAQGRIVHSGVYFYVLEAGRYRDSRRMVLLK